MKNYKKNIFVSDISYKTLFGTKPLRIRFSKVHGFIGVYDGIRYLVLFRTEKCDAIYNGIRNFISQIMVLHILFLIVMQESKFVHMILCL